MYQRHASTPYFAKKVSIVGRSTKFPSDFDIFCPLRIQNECAYTHFGIGSPSAISIAGQITAWNQRISLPIT